jgi:hypothetical protein
MSMETTLARGIADQAARAWRDHKRHCGTCALAAQRRRWDELCPAGAQDRDAHTEVQARLAESRRLDKLPSPDQEPLFGAAGGRSFSNGNGPGQVPDQWSGWVTTAAHWWLM